ncbi:MAG: hypothetical protein CUN56_10785 [Phototrophicales bacterium]|nr:MAG: hypothetical protein CUN56_10785 [Phototrophicales bacterium]RMG72935.1 MAG: hypothetical protein D6711_12000 [Chloroflexota bacterium]
MFLWLVFLGIMLLQPNMNLERVLFTSDRDGNWEIYTMLIDGRNPRRLTEHPADDWYPSWSPDGNEIVFTSNRSGSFELYLMAIDGTNVRQLTYTPLLEETAPVWSPDGERIVYVASPPHDLAAGEIYVIDVDEPIAQQLTNNAVRDDFPSWSPDGSEIVFQRQTNEQFDLYVMDADGNNVRPLILDGIVPSWSPDGRYIAFASNRTGNREVYVANSDGSNIQQVTDTPGVDSFPRWSFDSERLIFGSNRDGTTFDLYLLTLSTGQVQRLTNTSANEGAPSLWGNALVSVATQPPPTALPTDSLPTQIFTPTPLPICLINALNTVNLRIGPGTTYDRAGTLPAGTSINADGQATGVDGFIWWRLVDERWVRSDVVETAGECDALPKIDLAEDE